MSGISARRALVNRSLTETSASCVKSRRRSPKVTEKSLSARVSQTRSDCAHYKIEFDAERIRSSVARLASNSIDDLEKLASELQQLQQFLKSDTERVQDQIGDVLARNQDHNGNHCSVENHRRRWPTECFTQMGVTHSGGAGSVSALRRKDVR